MRVQERGPRRLRLAGRERRLEPQARLFSHGQLDARRVQKDAARLFELGEVRIHVQLIRRRIPRLRHAKHRLYGAVLRNRPARGRGGDAWHRAVEVRAAQEREFEKGIERRGRLRKHVGIDTQRVHQLERHVGQATEERDLV